MTDCFDNVHLPYYLIITELCMFHAFLCILCYKGIKAVGKLLTNNY